MSASWQQVAHSTAEKYIKGREDLTIRDRFLLERLRSRGRIVSQKGGKDVRWKQKVRQHSVTAVSGLEQLSFESLQPYEGMSIPWKMYRASDMMTRLEKAENDGDAAIVRRYAEITPDLVSDVTQELCKDLFVDGYASGNERKLTGLRSCTGHTAGSTAAADWIAFPNDTYGGQSTALGSLGGSWSQNETTSPNAANDTDWPFGSGSSEYDAFTPKLIKTDTTAFGENPDTWAENCLKAIRYAMAALQNTNGRGGMADTGVMGQQMFVEFKNKQESKFSINIPSYKPSDDTGFNGTVLPFEGCNLSTDFDCPATWAFIVQVAEMELRTLRTDNQEGLLFVVGPEYDMRSDSDLFHTGFLGNLRYRPKGIAALSTFTASA